MGRGPQDVGEIRVVPGGYLAVALEGAPVLGLAYEVGRKCHTTAMFVASSPSAEVVFNGDVEKNVRCFRFASGCARPREDCSPHDLTQFFARRLHSSGVAKNQSHTRFHTRLATNPTATPASDGSGHQGRTTSLRS